MVVQVLNTGRDNEIRLIHSWSIGDVTVMQGDKGPRYVYNGVMLIGMTPSGDYVYENGQTVNVRAHLEKLPPNARESALAWFDKKYSKPQTPKNAKVSLDAS